MVSVGCGSSDAPGSGAAGSAGASASGAGGQTSGGQTSGGQADGQAGSEPGGSAGTLAIGAASGTGGGATEDQPLLPLVSGHRSSFVFSPIDADKPMTDTCDNPTTAVQSDEGFVTLHGHVGKLYRTFCAIEAHLIEGEGDDLTAHEIKNGALVPPGIAYIHSPVKTGETWDSGRGDRYTWQAVTSPLVTPAGTFDHCWIRYGSDTLITYCRGVGLVRATGSYGNYQLELVEKNF